MTPRQRALLPHHPRPRPGEHNSIYCDIEYQEGHFLEIVDPLTSTAEPGVIEAGTLCLLAEAYPCKSYGDRDSNPWKARAFHADGYRRAVRLMVNGKVFIAVINFRHGVKFIYDN